MIAPLINGILYRLDGWGKGDSFLPCWPFDRFDVLKTGGINYARYLIGIVAWIATGEAIYALTYAIAVSIPYGEDSITAKIFGKMRWFVVGFFFGLASLSFANATWCGLLVMALKFIDTDQAVFEFLLGSLGTVMLTWR